MAGKNLLEGMSIPASGRNLLGPVSGKVPGTPQASKDIPWSSVPGMAADNFGASAVQFGSNMVHLISHPVDTAQSLGNLALGGMQKAIPDSWTGGPMGSEKYADAVGEFFSKRYGGADEIKRTIATDPVGFLSDFSAFLTGGAGLAAKIPGVAGRATNIAGKIGKFADPLAGPAHAVGGVIKGATNPAASRLMAQGVTPTAGQILGGGFKKTEDALSSIPVLGSAIAGGRQRANTQFNTAAYDRALGPIGESAKGLEAGSTGIATISDKLSAAYDALLGRVSLTPDGALLDDIVAAVGGVRDVIDPNAAKVLDGIIDNKVMSKLDSGLPLSGEQLKVIQSELGGLVSKYGSSGTAADRIIGEALEGVQSSIRQALVRSNPQHARELRAIDEGYANYTRLRRAGAAPGAELKGFTPAQLRTAVKAEDRSVGKGDFSRGRSLMQDLSRDATDVMGGTLATSGTTERGILAGLLAGGAYVDPITAAIVAAGSTPYLPGVQRAVAAALASRPQAARATGRAVQQYGPRVGQTAFQIGRLEEELRRQR